MREVGNLLPPVINCCKTALTVTSKALVIIEVGASGFGCDRRVTSANAFLALLTAVIKVSVQIRSVIFEEDDCDYNCCRISAQ